jgi:hypothetical protein
MNSHGKLPCSSLDIRKMLWIGLIAAMLPTSALCLPIGYKEDFNGCSTTENRDDRERCCDETARDCRQQCSDSFGSNQPGGWIICNDECDEANKSCKNGVQLNPGIAWPERPELYIPGLYVDDGHIIPEKGFTLDESNHSIVIEIRSAGPQRGSLECVAAVTICECAPERSADDSAGAQCRPLVISGRAECRSYSNAENAESSKFCSACVPVVVSTQPCDSVKRDRDRRPDRPHRHYHDSDKR